MLPPSGLRPTLLLGAFLGLTAASLGGQSPQEPPAVGRLLFRAGVEYVSLDVVVTDEAGHAVTDLTAKDFAVTDRGQRQDILAFDHIAIAPSRRKIDPHALPLPPSDVATNVPPGPSSRAFVFVIDDSTIRPEGIVPLKRFLTQAFETVTPADRVALVFVSRSDLAMDFTSDFGRLARSLSSLDKIAGAKASAQATRLVLVNVVNVLATAPETRRAVVFLSGGHGISPSAPGLDMPKPSTVFTIPGLEDLFERAHKADVVIYSADPHGLLALDTGVATGGAPARQLHGVGLQDFMRTVSENTEGLALVNVNDMIGAANAIMADNADYYVLGYSPAPYVADNRFHETDVAVDRPGLHVRARKGYFAAPPAPEPRAQLQAGIGDGQTHSDLGLRVFLAPVTPTSAGARAVMTMDVHYPALTGPAGRTDDDLDVAVVALDPDGHVERSEPQTFHVALSAAHRDAVTVSVDDVVELPRGKWTLRVGVASHLLGTLGTVHFPVEVPDFNGRSFTTTPLILGVRSPTALIGRPEAIATLVPLQPTTERVFTRATELHAFVRVFSPTPADVRVDLRLRAGPTVLQTIPVRCTPVPGAATALDCEGALALAAWPEATYVIELSARGVGGQARTQAVAFDVR